MSGGRYGRGKAPERQCLKVEDWPAEDRSTWLAACSPGSLLDDDFGVRSAHARISNAKDAKGYGRWLTHLAFHDAPALELTPGERITGQRVTRYVQRLEEMGLSSQTILDRLQELGAVAKVMRPDGDWRLINRIAAKIRARHKPARDKTYRVLSHQLVDLGLTLMSSAGENMSTENAIQYRDGLIIGLLALVPLRRRNLTALALGSTLTEIGNRFIISFAEGETKTGSPLELLLPEALIGPLRVYLEKWRPLLCARTGRWTAPAGAALWISKDGSPMTQMAIYDRVKARTQTAFGTAVNPHAFRHAAATTQAIADPANVRIAAPLLGHRTFNTTERYYQQAEGYIAQRTFLDTIENLKMSGHNA